jgi:hypothetical protein
MERTIKTIVEMEWAGACLGGKVQEVYSRRGLISLLSFFVSSQRTPEKPKAVVWNDMFPSAFSRADVCQLPA